VWRKLRAFKQNGTNIVVFRDHLPGNTQSTNAHRITRIILIILAVLLIWYVVSDRLTPYTAAVRLQPYVIPIVPDVSGYIRDIPIRQYSQAQAGDKLLQIETSRFELALRRAEAALSLAVAAPTPFFKLPTA
jgi:multidrug resistance efflux pump